ncbi:MAG: AarF/UbiB family protein [Acidimicrobiales bacterium]|nr:AarF/UbiB family protein [Acidimicrobiales bacterium]
MSPAAITDLAQQCAQSPWVQAQPGLELAACRLERELGGREPLASRAERIASPGLGPAPRTLHQVAALQVAQLRSVLRRLPEAGRRATPPMEVLKDGVADLMRHHLALLGPPGAEVARIFVGSGSMAPDRVVQRLREEPIPWDPQPAHLVERVTDRALPGLIRSIEPEPLGATPVLQAHRCHLADGTPAIVRVRRPGARRALLADARFSGTLAWAVEQVAPGVRDAHPQGFVQLAVRQLLDSLDLRNHALNAIELGLAVEALDIAGVRIARPIPAGITASAALFEHVDGDPLHADHTPTASAEPEVGLAALLVLSAVGRGVFHADAGPEHLLRSSDGTITLVGCPVLGRLTPELRRAGYAYLTAVLSGDHAAQVEAMRQAGAVPDGIDEGALIADLVAGGSIDPMALMDSSGQGALLEGLRDAVGILLRHRLRPPLEVVLLVRGLFALQQVLPLAAPGASLTGALLPLLPRLPELAADDR